MPRPATAFPIPAKELLRMQGQLPPYGSMMWDDGPASILVARIPGRDPDLVNDVERVAEWASPGDILRAQACIMLTAGKVHTLPMAPLRSHMERRIALDRRQAGLLRDQLPAGLSYKLYRAVDDPYRRTRLGVLFPDARMRDVDDARLDELAAKMGSMLNGGLDDVHCVHLVSATDDVRLAPDAFLADMIPRLQDPRRRGEAEQRLRDQQQADAEARGVEGQALRRQLGGGQGTRVAPVKVRPDGRSHLDWEPGADGPTGTGHSSTDGRSGGPGRMDDIHARIDAMGRKGVERHGATPMSLLRRRLMDAGYGLRIAPDTPGHSVDLAAEHPDASPQRILAWSADVLDADVAERALAATRDLGAELGIVLAPEADAAGRRVLVATRVRWVTPDRIEGLLL